MHSSKCFLQALRQIYCRPSKACLFLLLLIAFSACETKTQNTNPEKLRAIYDSIKVTEATVAFEEDEALCLIKRSEKDSNTFIKIVYRKNFPTYFDTLIRSNDSSFLSKRFEVMYVLQDSSVVCKYIERMVHPCYTWQGQTPVGRNMSIHHKRFYN